MQISEVRIKLVENRSDRLKAFCTVTFDNAFVVRDLKIIEGAGGYFVAMPSRKLTDRCPSCGSKNHLRARFCNDCGGKLDESRADQTGAERTKLHADIAHPVNTQSREYIQTKVIEAFHEEVERSKQPGYKPARWDDDFDEDVSHHSSARAAPKQPPPDPSKPSETSAPPMPPEPGGFGEGIF